MMQTKRKQMFLQLYDHTGFERKLEALALKGWKLEKCGGILGWKFRKIEPAKLRYKVVYFPDASEFDPAPDDRQAEYIELCDKSGWEYIDHSAQMLIFCTKYPYATPIETDAMMQVETIHKAMKKSYLPGQIGLLALAVLQMLLCAARWRREPVNMLLFDGLLMSYVSYILLGVLCAYHLVQYFLWRRKALVAAEDGEFVETKGRNFFEKISLVILAAWFIPWLISLSDDAYLLRVALMTFAVLVGMIALVNGTKVLMQKMEFDAETTRIATWSAVLLGTVMAIGILLFGIFDWPAAPSAQKEGYVTTYEYLGRTHYIYDDPIPLTLEQLGIDAEYENRSRVQDVTKSMLITVYNGQEVAPWGMPVQNLPELYYTITIPKLNLLLDACVEDVLNDRRIDNLYGISREVDGELWQAKCVFERVQEENSNVHYTVVWEDRILEILLPMSPNDEQIHVIIEHLKTYNP